MMMRLAQDNSIMDNIDYKAKVGFVPAGDGGRVTIVLSFASESPSLLGAEVPVYARVHPISAIFPSQRRRIVPGPQACGAKNALVKDVPAKSGAEASVDETGVIKNDPALKPATKVATALKPAAVCGETLPSIKEFPEEEPAPAASASQHHSVHTLWSTP